MNHFRATASGFPLVFVGMFLLLTGCEPEPLLDEPISDSGDHFDQDSSWNEDAWWDQDIALNDEVDTPETEEDIGEIEDDIEEPQADHPDFVVVADILRTSCGTAGCHGAVPQGKFQIEGGMDATNNQVRAALEGVTANTGEMLVEPGNAGVSGIYYRLLLEDPSRRMPPAPFTALEQENIDAISNWIDAGAPYEQTD